MKWTIPQSLTKTLELITSVLLLLFIFTWKIEWLFYPLAFMLLTLQVLIYRSYYQQGNTKTFWKNKLGGLIVGGVLLIYLVVKSNFF